MLKNFVIFVLSTCVTQVLTQNLNLVLSQPLTNPSPNILATSLLLTFQPGDQGIGPHTHSGPVVGFVIEGSLLFQVEGRDPTILEAGSSFYEDDKAIHLFGGNASNDTVCKVIATIYGRPEEEFVTMTPEKTRDDFETTLKKAMDLELLKQNSSIIQKQNFTASPDAESPNL